VGSSGRSIKSTGIGFLKTTIQTGKSGRSDSARATSLQGTFGMERLDGLPDATSDEALEDLHLHHTLRRSMSPSGRSLFQLQFGTLNSILFTNI
jgi:hypothetical protein